MNEGNAYRRARKEDYALKNYILQLQYNCIILKQLHLEHYCNIHAV